MWRTYGNSANDARSWKNDQHYNHNLNTAISAAASGGHVEIVKLFITLGANNYNKIMEDAASGGCIEIVKMMIDLGASNYSNALCYAAKTNQPLIPVWK